jgi:hypothetical protein
MERRIEESICGVPPESRNIFRADGPPPEVTLLENEEKQSAKYIENGEAMFVFTASSQSLSKRDSFTESLEFGQ